MHNQGQIYLVAGSANITAACKHNLYLTITHQSAENIQYVLYTLMSYYLIWNQCTYVESFKKI